MQVYVFVFQASPQPLDEDVVHAPALAVHADPDAVGLQHAGEVGAGELTALIGIEDLRPAEPSQRLFQGIDTEVGVQRVRKPPGQHRPRVPVHDRHQVDEGTWSETPAWFRTKLFVASDASIALSFSDVSDAPQFLTSPLRSSNNLDYRANPPHGRNTDIGCR